MGSDISMVFEVYDSDKGWRNVQPEVMCVHDGDLERDGNLCFFCRELNGIFPSDSLHRNYKLFSLMMKGFRSRYPRQGINPRGEPLNISKKSQAVFWHWGDKCQSWVTLSELLGAMSLLSNEEPKAQLQALVTELAYYADSAEHVRILFMFD